MALVLGLVIVPAAILVSYAFRETTFVGVGPGPTLQQFRDLLAEDYFFRVARRTLWMGLSTGLTVTALSFVMCYGLRFRFSRKVGLVLLGTALAAGIASFLVRIFAWGTILGTNGLLNSALLKVGVIDRPLEFLLYSSWSVMITMTYLYLPIGIAIVYGAMQDVDPHALEAGRDLGAGRMRTAFQVVEPQVRGALKVSFVVTTILASADFITPSLVGGTQGTMIGVVIRDRALSASDLPGAASVALAFLAALFLTIAAVMLLAKLLGRLARMADRPYNAMASVIVSRSPGFMARISLSRIAAVAIVLYLIAPTFVVVVFSFNDSQSLGLPWQGFTTTWYSDVLERPGLQASLRTSLILALASAGGALVLGGALAFALAKVIGPKTRAMLLAVTMVPFVVPPILIGLGLLVLADMTGLRLGLGLTVFAHVTLLIPFVVAVLVGRLAKLNPELVQAARDLGSSSRRAFRTVTLPLVLPSLAAVFVICFAVSMDEVLVTTFTIGQGSTLPTWILGRARLGFDPGLNAIGVMLVAATLVIPAICYLAIRWVTVRRRAESIALLEEIL